MLVSRLVGLSPEGSASRPQYDAGEDVEPFRREIEEGSPAILRLSHLADEVEKVWRPPGYEAEDRR
jgi:hypothetical protein